MASEDSRLNVVGTAAAMCVIDASPFEGRNDEIVISESSLREDVESRKSEEISERRLEEATSAACDDPEQKLKDAQNEYVRRTLESTVAVMTSKVEKMEQQVLQVARFRSTLKRTKSQDIQSSLSSKERERERGNLGNKRQRLLDAARCEAARRGRMADIVRQFCNIFRQIMQHKWAWPFVKPVDVEGLNLHDYYRVIRKPMDLGTIRNRLEAKDGSSYRHVREMCEDVRLVFRNAMMYNESSTDVHKMAKALLQKFEEKWKTFIEPKLLEEEANSTEGQQELYASKIAELHAGEERAVEELAEDVCVQLTDLEKQLESYIVKVLSNCRTMSAEEKRVLGQKISQLPSSSLNRVVEIIAQANNCVEPAAEKVQISLDEMDQATLWRLHFFVKMIANSRKD